MRGSLPCEVQAASGRLEWQGVGGCNAVAETLVVRLKKCSEQKLLTREIVLLFWTNNDKGFVAIKKTFVLMQRIMLVHNWPCPGPHRGVFPVRRAPSASFRL